MTGDERIRTAGPVAAWFSGIVAGVVMILIGILAAPPPASNELALPRPAIEPVCIWLAAALAAIVPSWRLRAPIGQMLALALGAAIFTFILAQWIGHWTTVGTLIHRGNVDWRAVMLRRDLGVSFLGVNAAALLSTVVGKR